MTLHGFLEPRTRPHIRAHKPSGYMPDPLWSMCQNFVAGINLERIDPASECPDMLSGSVISEYLKSATQQIFQDDPEGYLDWVKEDVAEARLSRWILCKNVDTQSEFENAYPPSRMETIEPAFNWEEYTQYVSNKFGTRRSEGHFIEVEDEDSKATFAFIKREESDDNSSQPNTFNPEYMDYWFKAHLSNTRR